MCKLAKIFFWDSFWDRKSFEILRGGDVYSTYSLCRRLKTFPSLVHGGCCWIERGSLLCFVERNANTRLGDIKLRIPHYESKQISRCMKPRPLPIIFRQKISFKNPDCLSLFLLKSLFNIIEHEILHCHSYNVCSLKHGNANSSKESLQIYRRYVEQSRVFSKLTFLCR